MSRPRFHLAIPVQDLAAAHRFYAGVLGCGLGRESDRWIDFDFFGHQVTVHLAEEAGEAVPTNPVDGHAVPARHFGLILDLGTWETLRDRLKAAEAPFLIEPHERFPGTRGAQHTLFVLDPSGNGLEFKAFADEAMIFDRMGFEGAHG
jgi:extradiol dioxygenase family protein